jgi:hypothetical protein
MSQTTATLNFSRNKEELGNISWDRLCEGLHKFVPLCSLCCTAAGRHGCGNNLGGGLTAAIEEVQEEGEWVCIKVAALAMRWLLHTDCLCGVPDSACLSRVSFKKFHEAALEKWTEIFGLGLHFLEEEGRLRKLCQLLERLLWLLPSGRRRKMI